MKNGTIKNFVGWSDHGLGTENARADYWASNEDICCLNVQGAQRSTVTTTDAASVYKYKHNTIEGIVDVSILLIIYTSLM